MFQDLFNTYNDFHVKEIITNRFQPETYHQILDSLLTKAQVETLGHSVQGREIRSITIGSGPSHVLLWSQMHGNESTASRAILDVLHYHKNELAKNVSWQKVLERLTIKIIPILNPDGTARFIRRNALDIDLNRDARQFISPEAKILRDVLSKFKPEVAFNLHDQRRFYNIDGTGNPSTISFLAPAYNEAEEVNASRLKAMQLIADLRNSLEAVIPGQIGIYNDSFSPRAFGDYAQATGAATILIESGWEKFDMEKEFVRKLNACMLISAFESISHEHYNKYQEQDYRNIPMNAERLFDVLIRNASFIKENKRYSADIGIVRSEISLIPSEKYYSKGIIEDFGDLKEWYGFEEVDASELLITPGKVLEISYAAWQQLDDLEKHNYLKEGYIFIAEAAPHTNEYCDGPMNIVGAINNDQVRLEPESLANFLLINRAGEIKYIIINGFLWPVHESIPEVINGLIIN